MKGMVWEFWIYGMVAFFIAIVVYFTITPFYMAIISTFTQGSLGNFSTAAVNISYHNTATYNKNLWDMWPIAIGAIAFLLFFIAASEEEKMQTTGRY